MESTVNKIKALSPLLGGLAANIDDAVKSIDVNRGIPSWYWNGKSPRSMALTNLDGATHEQSKARSQNLGIVYLRLVKAVGILNVCNDLIVYMRGLPVQNPSSDSNFLQDKISIANAFLDNALKNKYCVHEGYPDFVKRSLEESKEIQWSINSQTGDPIVEKCFAPATPALVKTRISESFYNYAKNLNKTSEGRAYVEHTMLRLVDDEISALKSSIQAFYSRFQALPELYQTEVSEGVTPEFKVELNKPFLDEAEILLDNQNSPPEPEYDPIPWYLIAIPAIAIGGIIGWRR